MQISQTLLIALVGALSTVHASPTVPEPKADCCSCDLQNPGPNYICRVPPKGVCTVPKIACPYDPKTHEQCCCCDIAAEAMRCQAVPKGTGCICTLVKCPFQFNMTYLPTP